MRQRIVIMKNAAHTTIEKLTAKNLVTVLAASVMLSACSTADKVDEPIAAQPVAAATPETRLEPETDTQLITETEILPISETKTLPISETDSQLITADVVREIPETTASSVEIANFDSAKEPTQKPEPIPEQVPEEETLNITLATLRAERGDVESQLALGKAYATGTPQVGKDPEQARLWFELASLKGDSRAQYELGNLFYTGQGVDKDYFNAREWWLESALQGNLDAQQKIGYLYSEGLGVQRDFDKAKLWYSKAAKRGHAEAQTLLGSLYHEGDRIPVDYSEAFKWYKLAAEQGHPHAQYTLATLFHDGLGTKVDYIQCAAWVDVAIANGFDDEFDTKASCRNQLDDLSNRTATHLADVWMQNYLSPGI